jgi:hypothetical protein
MSKVIRLLHGEFGRVALLEMDAPLVTHAHHHCHILCKVGGPDTAFQVREKNCPLTNDNAVLINAWEEAAYIAAQIRRSPEISGLLGVHYLFLTGGKSVQWPCAASAARPTDSPKVG